MEISLWQMCVSLFLPQLWGSSCQGTASLNFREVLSFMKQEDTPQSMFTFPILAEEVPRESLVSSSVLASLWCLTLSHPPGPPLSTTEQN